MVAKAQRLPLVAGERINIAAATAVIRKHLRERRRAARRAAIVKFWKAIEPGITIDRNNSIESWNAEAEGRATSVSFEGFGITLLLFIGRTPKAVRS